MSVYPKQKNNEVIGVLLLASAALMLLSLVSYSAWDASWNVSTSESGYQNYVGRVGAWLADMLLQLFGLPTFLLPVSFLILGIRKLRGGSWVYPLTQSLGLVLCLFSLCTLLSLLAPFLELTWSFLPGGVCGVIIGSLLEHYFNTPGAVVVAGTLLILSLLVATPLSVGTLGTRLPAAGGRWFRGRIERYQQWRKQRKDRRQMKKMRTQNGSVLTTRTPPASSIPLSVDAEEKSLSPPEAHPEPEPVVSTRQTLTLWEEEEEEVGDEEMPVAEIQRQYRFPSLDFLQLPTSPPAVDEPLLLERARRLSNKCAEFGVTGRVLQIHPGPVVTTFEFKPDAGIKYNRITSLVDDLCLGLKAESIRIDRIPGKNTVGIEVPNLERQTILLREIFNSAAFQESSALLTLGLGKLINGNTYVTELSRMPHLLIAGATGSGKSVAINCLVCSILYKASPQQVRFILIDPKRLELGLYADIPHLLTPIVSDPKKAANALGWAVREMERRYKLLARKGVRNLAQYNEAVRESPETEEGEEALEPLPLIVVIVDELADLMMTAGKEVELSLTRLAQMARAIGIHLILATQRPSVDVITGLIKANFPSRISFRVSSKIDSRTVLDTNGAEQLLGQGDMLFLSPRTARPVRIHGALVTEKEIHQIANFLRSQGEPDYREDVLEGVEEEKESAVVDVADLEDPLYDEAARFVVESGKASTSLLQRRLRIGYGRAARLLDIMEHEGLISPPDGSKARDVLVPRNYFDG